MTTPTPASISQRLTSTSSLLLERSRILSLGLRPSPSSQNQITRNLTAIRADLDQLELHSQGLALGGKAGKGKATGTRSGSGPGTGSGREELEEMGERYDRLLEMFAEDDVGREKVKGLKREQRPVTPPQPSFQIGSDSPSHSRSRTPPRALSPASASSSVPRVSIEPPTPGVVERFRDFPDDYDPESASRYGDDGDGQGEGDHREMLSNQQEMMDDQDARLNLLSHSIGRQNHLSIQIGSELDIHHQLLEDTDAAMDRTSASLGRARRRLDRVAQDAKQYGSTITIVALIFILLILIIVFKT